MLTMPNRQGATGTLRPVTTNVAAHWSVDHHARLVIQDFGRGMPAASATGVDEEVPGVGIPGMRERLRHFGGRLNVRSSSRGTTLEVIVPVHAESPRPAPPPGRPDTDS